MAKENVKHWKIGDVEVARLVEVNAFEDNMWMLLDGATEEFVQQYKWLVPHFATPGGKMIISFQCFVLRSKGKSVMIDTCIGADRKREFDVFCNLQTTFLEDLEYAGFPRASITDVLCTHLYFDHVGWNTRLQNGKWVPTFPNAKYVMSRTDHDFWEQEAKRPGTEAFKVNTYNDSVLPIVEAKKAEFVTGEHGMCGCLTLKPAPGHTPGQIRVDLDSRGKRAIFAGDALHNPVQVPLWKWNSVFCEDRDLARKSRHELLADCVEQGALLMPAHFAPPHAAYIKDKSDRFELDWDHDNKRGR